jgi:hypothetical protein
VRVLLLACLCVALAVAGAVSTGADASPSGTQAWCSHAISWQQARRSIGEMVRVKASVASAVYARSTNGRPTFLNLGHAYPSRNRLTVLIWGEDRVNFPYAPERMFARGRTICAQGFVSRYDGVPQIEVALYDPVDRLLSF